MAVATHPPQTTTAQGTTRRSGREPRGPAGLGIAVLLALLGFTLAVQVRSTTTDALAGARQEDLVRILSDLEAQEQRLNQEITRLEESQRQLASGAEGRQAALQEATGWDARLVALAAVAGPGSGQQVKHLPGQRRPEALRGTRAGRGDGLRVLRPGGGDGDDVRPDGVG